MVFFEVPNHGNHSTFCHLSNYHSIAIWFTDTMISPQYSFVMLSFSLAVWLWPQTEVSAHVWKCGWVESSPLREPAGSCSVSAWLSRKAVCHVPALHTPKNRERTKDFIYCRPAVHLQRMKVMFLSSLRFPRPGISSQRVNNVARLYKVLLANKCAHRKASFPDTD